jgi:hypothetical protein
MTDRIAVLRREALDERSRLSEAFDTLEVEIKKVVDWRGAIRDNPTEAVAVALGAGIVVGMLSRNGSPGRQVPVSAREPRGTEPSFFTEVGRDVWREGRNMALLWLTRSLTSILTDRTTK